MDRAYDLQSKKFLVKETIPKINPKRLSSHVNSPTHQQNNSNNKCKSRNCSKGIRASNEQKTLDTNPLDEAMQELLDICQHYNDKIQHKQQQQPRDFPALTKRDHPDKLNSTMQAPSHQLVHTTTTTSNAKTAPTTTTNTQEEEEEKEEFKTICDRKLDKKKQEQVLEQHQPAQLKNSSQYNAQSNNFIHHPRVPAAESIETLQEKQAELQRQLDEVLLVAKKLTSKQRRNLTDIIEDPEDLEVQTIIKQNHQPAAGTDALVEQAPKEVEGEEEDELIEFQQIENELRISDLKRQLDNIQEELRIRLFKRLVSNTGAKHHNRGPKDFRDDRSPSSSSCSDVTSTNGLNALNTCLPKTATTTNGIKRGLRTFDVTDGSIVGKSEQLELAQTRDIHETSDANNGFHSITYNQSDQTSTPNKSNNIESNCSDQDSAVDYTEALTPTTSKESVMSKKSPSIDATHPRGQPTKDTVSPYQAMSPYVHTASPVHSGSNHRNNSANSDLERIEEDEDEDEDDEEQDVYYCSSDKFRSIYEEKLSPKALGHVATDNYSNDQDQNRSTPVGNSDAFDDYQRQQPPDDASKLISEQQLSNSSPHLGRYKVQPSSVKPSANEATNRPLTLYLPQPDEEIDLVEHVQTLGHDTSIISDDLQLSSRSAEGYLWKCCAKNNKKWLRRYFYYDRESKIVAYFKSKSQLAKKNPSPRNTIPFEEISDVYVDHRLSGLVSDKGGDNSSPKGRNYVFVLATIGRKYLLASSKAETMRAWIDILFTAAKANDYLEHLEHMDDDEDDDANDDSLR